MTVAERFDAMVCPEPMTGCWLWTGATMPKGYGRISIRRSVSRLAHRVSWSLYRGPIPEGQFVCHHCDTPSCVNPDHLFLGTAKDNNVDAAVKGRTHRPFGSERARGALHGASRLTDDAVRKIRRSVPSEYQALAAEYGVSRRYIGDVKNRQRWKHVED